MAEWWEIKLNPKKLNKMLKEELSRIEEDEQYGLMYDFRLIAAGRYYMYLGNFDEGKKYILKAIEAKKKRIEEAISKLGYGNDAIAMNKTRLAKMYRWIGDIEKLKQECFEAVKIFRKVYEEAKKMNDSLARNPEVCSYFYVLWADAEYYLGNYQMAVDVEKVFAKNTTGIVSSALAEYILKNDA